jgi:hypothetical protein
MTRLRPRPTVRRGPIVSFGERPQRFVFQVLTQVQAEELARAQLHATGLENDPFVDELVAEFGFAPDRAKEVLVKILAYSPPGARPYTNAYPPGYDEREPDTLDKLAEPIDLVVQLLDDPKNAYRLLRELVHREPERAAATGQTPATAGEIDSELAGLPDLLRDIRDAIPKAHHGRTQKSGPLSTKGELAQVAAMLGQFWIEATGTPFEWSHTNWAKGKHDIDEPVRDPARFVFRVVERLWPGRGQELRGIRKIAVNQQPRPGKPAGRPPVSRRETILPNFGK